MKYLLVLVALLGLSACGPDDDYQSSRHYSGSCSEVSSDGLVATGVPRNPIAITGTMCGPDLIGNEPGRCWPINDDAVSITPDGHLWCWGCQCLVDQDFRYSILIFY